MSEKGLHTSLRERFTLKSSNNPKSRITGKTTRKLFEATVLNKYNVSYFQCVDTGFIQTEPPYWLDEAYDEAITSLDIGLVGRNLACRDITGQIITSCFAPNGRFVDFGGGYGLFVRLMRDRGFNFYRYDIHCPNLFAKTFEWNDSEGSTAELLTAWEVFEHLADPVASLEQLLQFSDNILFSTSLIPSGTISSASDWWYFTPQLGQHVSFYTDQALQCLAARFGLRFYTDGQSTHMFTRRPIKNPFKPKFKWTLKRRIYKLKQVVGLPSSTKSLLTADFEKLQQMLSESPINANAVPYE